MKALIVFFLFLISTRASSQENIYCGQYEMDQLYRLQDPTLDQKRDTLEKFTHDYTDNYFKRLKRNQINYDTALFIIPVVFHIMHNYGPENISKEQVWDAVRIINEDYQKRNADTTNVIALFKSIIGNSQIEFRLARLDPDGKCTDGITRHQTLLTYGGDELLKDIVQWPPEKYLNIWVENSSSANFAGSSNFPGSPANRDGVLILHNYLGSIGTSSVNPDRFRVLTHEIGHYLNLAHIWGGSNTAGLPSNCNTDDFVDDTPRTIGSPFNCELDMSSCIPGVIDNVQNIMNYSTCDYMFTQGQSARMQAALYSELGGRNNLWSASNRFLTGTNDDFQAATCAPIADFTNKVYRICEGQSISFQHDSYGGDLSSFNWQFEGGDMASSSDQFPVVQYYSQGFFDVTLTVTNSAGTSSLTRHNIVEVSPQISLNPIPSAEDFETLNFPSGYWNYESGAGTHWEHTGAASASGVKSIYLMGDTTNIGDIDVFYTESYNLENIASPEFNFKLAFANGGMTEDNLKIFVSTDCSQSWVFKYSKTGNSLATTHDTSSNFIPAHDQWRQDAMNINSFSGHNNVRFKFQFTSAGGGNIFIDDINIDGATWLNDLHEQSLNLNIHPNPASEPVVISFDLISTAAVAFSLIDISGRTIFNRVAGKLQAGNQSFRIENMFSSGIYFLDLKIDGHHVTKKLIFTD